MLRALLPLAALALSGCAAHVSAPREPDARDSRFALTWGRCGNNPTCMGIAPLTVTLTIAAVAGAAISCSVVQVTVNGMVSGDAPDCAPGDHEGEGGLMVIQRTFGRGEHVMVVEVSEPGRRPVVARKLVVAL